MLIQSSLEAILLQECTHVHKQETLDEKLRGAERGAYSGVIHGMERDQVTVGCPLLSIPIELNSHIIFIDT